VNVIDVDAPPSGCTRLEMPREAVPGARPRLAAVARRVREDARLRRGLLALILLAAVAYREWRTYQWNATVPSGPERLHGDEPGFDSIAQELLDRRGFT
jgi:hypothetical protein